MQGDGGEQLVADGRGRPGMWPGHKRRKPSKRMPHTGLSVFPRPVSLREGATVFRLERSLMVWDNFTHPRQFF